MGSEMCIRDSYKKHILSKLMLNLGYGAAHIVGLLIVARVGLKVKVKKVFELMLLELLRPQHCLIKNLNRVILGESIIEKFNASILY